MCTDACLLTPANPPILPPYKPLLQNKPFLIPHSTHVSISSDIARDMLPHAKLSQMPYKVQQTQSSPAPMPRHTQNQSWQNYLALAWAISRRSTSCTWCAYLLGPPTSICIHQDVAIRYLSHMAMHLLGAPQRHVAFTSLNTLHLSSIIAVSSQGTAPLPSGPIAQHDHRQQLLVVWAGLLHQLSLAPVAVNWKVGCGGPARLLTAVVSSRARCQRTWQWRRYGRSGRGAAFLLCPKATHRTRRAARPRVEQRLHAGQLRCSWMVDGGSTSPGPV